ncbi:hypothetical protein [Methylorubrum extorquens]|uniref:hypothetical protein n=1 Tax=Methylorubrum extorquens TaxID=408 RepID=UPI00209F0F38|nr:hypothetical protein [Methylorubrum extorquens]MCP1539008.1 hypothetical protein [Methylorubrum extorquens]
MNGATVFQMVSGLGDAFGSAYTLVQWQSFYSVCTDPKGNSPVTALDNEVDEIAIQCVINKKTQEGILWRPSGWMDQSKPIISGQFALDVRVANRSDEGGAGWLASRSRRRPVPRREQLRLPPRVLQHPARLRRPWERGQPNRLRHGH